MLLNEFKEEVKDTGRVAWDIMFPVTAQGFSRTVGVAMLVIGASMIPLLLLMSLSGWGEWSGIYLVFPILLIIVAPLVLFIGSALRRYGGMLYVLGTFLFLSVWVAIGFLWYTVGEDFIKMW